MLPLPHSIFHASPAERVALARERFFEEGLRPTGLVSEAVIQSWGRCLRGRHDARRAVEFLPVSSSRTHRALQRNHELVEAWTGELPLLQEALRSTMCSVVLTDAHGVVIAAMPCGRAHERLMPVAHRVGVNLSEDAVGTTAPGIVVKTGRAVSVAGGEHFFDDVQTMHCAAAPIRDIAGRLAGVLDISSEGSPFGFDASALVGLYAGALENRLLRAQSNQLLVLRLQVHPALLDTTAAGLVGVDADGRLAWANGMAAGLLGTPPCDRPSGLPHAEDVFGLRLAALASLSSEQVRSVVLPNGLSVWVRSEQRAPDDRRSLFATAVVDPTPASAACESSPPARSATEIEPNHVDTVEEPRLVDATSLRACDRDLIARTLRDCGGNVSRTARLLRVSRGLIYRRLKS